MSRTALIASLLALGLAAPAVQADPVTYNFTDFWNIDTPNTVPDHVTASTFNGWSSCFTDSYAPWNYVCGTFGVGTLGFTVQAEAGWQFDALTFAFDGYTAATRRAATGRCTPASTTSRPRSTPASSATTSPANRTSR
jgi:hypothetical protein